MTESDPNLTHYNKLDKGGHFAAWEPLFFAAATVLTGSSQPAHRLFARTPANESHTLWVIGALRPASERWSA